jgi:hypothetical protein
VHINRTAGQVIAMAEAMRRDLMSGSSHRGGQLGVALHLRAEHEERSRSSPGAPTP